jgi:exonuclease SbcC
VQFEECVAGEWTPLQDRVANVEQAIEEAVGLDYGGFTKCVLLPQGKFAEFLSGEPKQRRALLVDLLDIGIYERIKVAANARAAKLATQVEMLERQLRDDYANATGEALAVATASLEIARPQLASAKEQRAALQEAHTHATTAKAAFDSERKHTADRDAKHGEVAAAEKVASGATTRLKALAEALVDAETKLKASPFDAALHDKLRMTRDTAARVEQRRAEAERTRTAAASIDVAAAEKANAAASKKRDEARILREAAETALRAAENADRAAALRSGLKPGDACPVCGEKVRMIAKPPPKSALEAAKKAERDARAAEAKAADAASKVANDLARITQEAASAAATAKKAADDLALEEAALKKSLPKGVAADAVTITAAFEQQDQVRRDHETLRHALEKARDDHAAHERAMAKSNEKIAGLKAEVELLERQIEHAIEARKNAASLVKSIAAAWDWPSVNDLIEQSKSPAPLLQQLLDAKQAETDTLTATIAKLENDVQAIETAITRAAELRADLETMKADQRTARDLGVLLRADNFQEFVIVEAMQVLAESATAHLSSLYDRFAVTVNDGEFAVVDHQQADQVRSAKTLSGGETFLASLALALALSERLPELRSASAVALESLFLDEGFGTLDREKLDTVIEVLQALRMEERMVGIITHVPELANEIPHRIEVLALADGTSTVRVGAA